MKKIVLPGLILLAFTLPVSPQTNIVLIGNHTTDSDKEIRVPIYLNNSINVGSVQIRLDYDPAVVSVYSDPTLDKGDFTAFYAPDNSRNTSGYITINTMQLGSDMSGNLTIGYVRLRAIGSSGGSVQPALSILTMTDNAGNDIIGRNGEAKAAETDGTIVEKPKVTPEVTPRNVTNVTTQRNKISQELLNEMEKAPDDKLRIIVQSANSINQSEKDMVMQTGAEVLTISESMFVAKATVEQINRIAEYKWVSLVGMDVRAEAHEAVQTPRAPFVNITAPLLALMLLSIKKRIKNEK